MHVKTQNNVYILARKKLLNLLAKFMLKCEWGCKLEAYEVTKFYCIIKTIKSLSWLCIEAVVLESKD